MLTYTFDKSQSPFFAVLRNRVDRYFVNNKIHHAENNTLLFKSALLISPALTLYGALVFFTPTPWIALILCLFLGLNLALIGFNVIHDGGQQSFPRHRWVNIPAAHLLNVLGGNAYFWPVSPGRPVTR